MTLSRVVSEIFNVDIRDLEIPVRGQSRSLKVVHFGPIFEIFDFKNAVTLKAGLGSVKVIENVTIR